MSLGLFTHCAGGCGVELVGGPGLCVPCAMVANGGVLPCSTCDGAGCDVCAFSGEADDVGWDYSTWQEGEAPQLRGPISTTEWLRGLEEAHVQAVIAESEAKAARRRAKGKQ